jgi:hypothetical protein
MSETIHHWLHSWLFGRLPKAGEARKKYRAERERARLEAAREITNQVN